MGFRGMVFDAWHGAFARFCMIFRTNSVRTPLCDVTEWRGTKSEVAEADEQLVRRQDCSAAAQP